MSHDCAWLLCDEPHYSNDAHPSDCLCEVCHVHRWQDWNIYPECEGCLRYLAQWLHENTDSEGCLIPEFCDYAETCPLYREIKDLEVSNER